MSDFHLLRPEALLLFVPILALFFIKRRKQSLTGEWQKLIHPKLQPYVMQQVQPKGHAQHWFVSTPLWAAAALCVLALAGPTWEKQDSPVFNSRAGLVIALDLSLSMTAQDVSPSRLQRAKYKIMDVFDLADMPAMALVAYAGDTHVATPLTRDTKTMEALLPSLSPYMMPLHGSHLVRLAEQTAALFNQADTQPRQLLLITDGVEPQDIDEATRIFNDNQIELSILAVGTEQGAPLVKPDGSFFTDAQGNVIMPGLEMENLVRLQQATGGRLAQLTHDDSDVQSLVRSNALIEAFEKTDEQLTFDQWHDAGYWLVLLALPFCLFAFRRGALIAVLLLALPLMPDSAYAADWRDWFRNADQQGMNQFESDPAQAAATFDNKQWRASSEYKAGNFDAAAQYWSEFNDAESHFNRGNALAQNQDIDAAIAAYDRALKLDPKHEDAAFNKALLESLKQQSQNQSGDSSDQQSSDNQSGDQQNNDSQNGDSQKQDGQTDANQNPSNQDQGQGQEQDSQDQSSQSPEQSSDQSPEQSSEQSPEQNSDQNQGQADLQNEQQQEEADKLAQQQAENTQAQDAAQTDAQTTAQDTGETSAGNLEQQQALQQWLNRIPDDPGDLLENKFKYQYNQRQYQDSNEDRKPW